MEAALVKQDLASFPNCKFPSRGFSSRCTTDSGSSKSLDMARLRGCQIEKCAVAGALMSVASRKVVAVQIADANTSSGVPPTFTMREG